MQLRFRRYAGFYVYNILVPVLMMSLIGVFTSFLPPFALEKVNLSVTVLLGFLFVQSIIATLVPKSESIPSLANYLLFSLFLSTINVIACSLVVAVCSLLGIYLMGIYVNVTELHSHSSNVYCTGTYAACTRIVKTFSLYTIQTHDVIHMDFENMVSYRCLLQLHNLGLWRTEPPLLVRIIVLRVIHGIIVRPLILVRLLSTAFLACLACLLWLRVHVGLWLWRARDSAVKRLRGERQKRDRESLQMRHLEQGHEYSYKLAATSAASDTERVDMVIANERGAGLSQVNTTAVHLSINNNVENDVSIPNTNNDSGNVGIERNHQSPATDADTVESLDQEEAEQVHQQHQQPTICPEDTIMSPIHHQQQKDHVKVNKVNDSWEEVAKTVNHLCSFAYLLSSIAILHFYLLPIIL